MNSFFKAVEAEIDPMYDAAIITEKGAEYWKYPSANNANNSHSVTKFFVATAIGILCDRGKLSLTTKITSLFTEDEKPGNMDPKWDNVTVRDALQHKTGMDTIPYSVDDDATSPKIGNDFLRFIFSLPIEQETGVYRRYSDAAYYLLCRVIAKASGKTADVFMREEIFVPLGFRQWSMACCPQGHPIGGGGFFARSDDVAKLGYTYACDGIYNGKRIISDTWIRDAMENDYACTEFRDTGVFLKTGANGQMVAFSKEKKTAVAWHGHSSPGNGNARNDRLLEAFVDYLHKAE